MRLSFHIMAFGRVYWQTAPSNAGNDAAGDGMSDYHNMFNRGDGYI